MSRSKTCPCGDSRPRLSGRAKLDSFSSPPCIALRCESTALLARLPASLLFFHLLADQRGMPRLRIDPGGHRQATACNRVGVLLFHNDAMLDGLGRVRRRQASYRSRRRTRRNRLLRPAPGQNQTNAEHTSHTTSRQPSLPHAISFRSHGPGLSMAILITVPEIGVSCIDVRQGCVERALLPAAFDVNFPVR